MAKTLRRTTTDRRVGGVCGGLARYFDIDATVVRVAYVLISVFTAFAGVLAYIIMLLLIPEEE